MTTSLEKSLAGNSPVQWAYDLLVAMGCPVTIPNLTVIYSWEYAESGGGGGMYNPLNTTQDGFPGETDYNSSGVKNYISYSDGIAATVKAFYNTNHGTAYAGIIAALKKGTSIPPIVDAITNSIWGTHYLPLRTLPYVPLGVEMQFVCSPQPPILPGRTAAARWNPNAPGQLRLENGARIAGDVATADPSVHILKLSIAPGCVCIGIAPRVSKGGTNKGRPDGTGIVVFDDHQNTYDLLWL